MTTRTKIIWSDRLEAHIRVEVPGTPGYDKHFWEFVYPAEERAWRLRRAASLDEQARSAKADARWHCEQARLARADGRRRHVIEHLREAERLIRRAYRAGEQSRLNRVRAGALVNEIEKVAA